MQAEEARSLSKLERANGRQKKLLAGAEPEKQRSIS